MPETPEIRKAGIRTEDMENYAPPPVPPYEPGDPLPADKRDVEVLRESLTEVKSIAKAAVAYDDNCAGGDTANYQNNCAHKLSDAFIRAGYTELLPPNDCIDGDGRCGTSSKRPLRARNMWCWFKKMHTEHRTTIPSGEGVWAVFQHQPGGYWGGHVVIINTDTNRYYGTGWYKTWNQYAYKW